MELTIDRSCAALVDQTDRFARTVAGVPADAPVPTCPAWSLTQLVEHIGQTHRFTTAIVGRRITGPEQLLTSYPELPAAQDAWAGWLRDGAEQADLDAVIDAALSVWPRFRRGG